MFSRVGKFIKLDTGQKMLFFEAYVTLGIMCAAILTVSFKRLTCFLEHSAQKSETAPLNRHDTHTAVLIGQAISRAAAYTPWESACLAQSLTAQKMLQKRGIAGVFYLGVAKDEEGKEKMKAHAWTQCGDRIITGGRGHEEFTVVSVFGWRKR